MISLLLALTLTTHCTVTSLSSSAILTCNDLQRTELVIPLSEWPREWSKPTLGVSYPVSNDWQPLSDAESIRLRSRIEQQRWMRDSYNNPKKP